MPAETTLPNPAILEEAKDYSQELPRDGNAPELTENQARGHKVSICRLYYVAQLTFGALGHTEEPNGLR